MTTDEQARLELDVETMLRERYRWGEALRRLDVRVGPRRYRIRFAWHDEKKWTAEVSGATREIYDWRARA